MQRYTTTTALLVLSLVANGIFSAADDGIKPTPRWANSCIILTGFLVCFGGETSSGTLLNNIYRLDLYSAWDATEPSWQNIETPHPIKSRAYFGSAPCWNKGLIVNGGATELNDIDPNDRNQSISTTYFYHAEWNTWSKPLIKGLSSLPPRKQHTATSDYQGRIWMWGGVSDSTTHKESATAYYSLWAMIDTNTWTYTMPVAHNANPPPRIDHTATLISNEEILIIGGMIYAKNVTDPSGSHSLLPVSMNQIMLYNTGTGKWRNHTAGGNIPAPRSGHSAVLDRDIDSIIIFGGGTHNDDQVLLNDVFVLQLENLEWSSPSIIGVPPKQRKYHQANLMDKLMLVTFGLGTNDNGYNDVHILDTSNWEWISNYTPNPGWLSGNINSSSGVRKNNTWIFGRPYLPTTQNPQGTFPNWADPNSPSPGDGTNSGDDGALTQVNPGDSKVKVGIIAAVISGGVVVLGGGIFLIIGKAIQRERQSKQQERRNHQSRQQTQQGNDKHYVGSSLVGWGGIYLVKPDNRSSYEHTYDDGEHHKPNEYDYPTTTIR
ncbi:hypothetical protein BC941DRAFT_510072 [Chlamydoabsidia padenii]|nr:hypothetical protein BC941DRAFT_510072 [Chlamydoabsidia padenii]